MVQWYYKVAGQVVGPLSAEQLKALAAVGRLAPGDPVARSAAGPWLAASRVTGLFGAGAMDDGGPQVGGKPPTDQPPASSPPVATRPILRPPEEPPVAQPPVAQPPVVMPGLTRPAGVPAPPVASSSESLAGQNPVPLGGFTIQTGETGAGQRRGKKQRAPLTESQKNVRLVKWLAAAFVLATGVFLSIPFLRDRTQPASDTATSTETALGDVAVGLPDGLEATFGPAAPGRERAGGSPARQPLAPAPAGSRSGPSEGFSPAPLEDDTIEVRPVRVTLDRPTLIDPDGKIIRAANRFLVVELELRQNGPAAARFHGWTDHGSEISLMDHRGVAYPIRTPRHFRGLFVEGQCRDAVFVTADEPAGDVVVFGWPEEEAPSLPSTSDEVLRLRLPKKPYGQQGELRFEIPLSEIEVTDEGATAPATTPPGGNRRGSADEGEADEEGRIPIPGL